MFDVCIVMSHELLSIKYKVQHKHTLTDEFDTGATFHLYLTKFCSVFVRKLWKLH